MQCQRCNELCTLPRKDVWPPHSLMRMAMRRGASGATAAPMRGRVCMRAQAKTAIEFDDLVEVIRAVDSSDLVEMELKGKKFAMSIKKQEALQAQEPIVVQAPAGALCCLRLHVTLQATAHPYAKVT